MPQTQCADRFEFEANAKSRPIEENVSYLMHKDNLRLLASPWA